MTLRTRTRTTTTAAVSTALLAATALAAPSAVAQDEIERGPAAAAQPDTFHSPLRGPGRHPGTAPYDRDGDRAARQQAIDKVVDDGAIGMVARVEDRDGKWYGGAGVRERGTKQPVRGNERLRVASNTKMMVATVVMQLVEEGTWTLDTTVGDVRPGLFPGRDDITVRQLLGHTSGAPTGDDYAVVSRMKDPTDWTEYMRVITGDFDDLDIIDGANAAEWHHEPGTGFAYSNAGYVALGMMLEEETGQEVGDLLKKRVFKPAGMHQTRFETGPGVRGPFLVGGTFTPHGYHSQRGFNPELFSSSGAVSSTTKDLNSFTEALVTGELVDKSLVELMTTPGDNPMAYGLGTYRMPDPCSPKGEQRYLVGHDGGTLGTLSMSFTSEDGKRQISLGLTGRTMREGTDQTQPYDLMKAFTDLAATTC